MEQLFSLVVRKGIIHPPLQGCYRSIERQDVEPAVIIEVEPGGAETGVRKAGGAESGTGALVVEHSGSVIDIEIAALAGQFGHEQIFVPVVVEVASVHPHA